MGEISERTKVYVNAIYHKTNISQDEPSESVRKANNIF